MSNVSKLLDRNAAFVRTFTAGELPPMPKLRTIVLTCADPRVDPAHILGVELGEVVVIRNTGARVTREIVQEIATLGFLGQRMAAPHLGGAIEIAIIQHTDCGAERLANPKIQLALRKQLGIDVARLAITDHEASLREDVQRLRDAPNVPRSAIVSAYMYDVHSGQLQEVVPPSPLSDGSLEVHG